MRRALKLVLQGAEQDYCKRNQRDFIEISCYVWAYQSEELINFWQSSGPGYGFHFPHNCGIVDFRRLISIYHSATGHFHDTQRND